MLSLTNGSAYISFAIGWEVSLVVRNTITHGGSQVRQTQLGLSGPMGTLPKLRRNRGGVTSIKTCKNE